MFVLGLYPVIRVLLPLLHPLDIKELIEALPLIEKIMYTDMYLLRIYRHIHNDSNGNIIYRTLSRASYSSDRFDPEQINTVYTRITILSQCNISIISGIFFNHDAIYNITDLKDEILYIEYNNHILSTSIFTKYIPFIRGLGITGNIPFKFITKNGKGVRTIKVTSLRFTNDIFQKINKGLNEYTLNHNDYILNIGINTPSVYYKIKLYKDSQTQTDPDMVNN